MTGSKKHLKPLKTRELGKAKIERRLTASWRLRFSWNFAGRRPWVTDHNRRWSVLPVPELTAEISGVPRGEFGPLLGQIVQREDSRYRANRHAGPAIDALYRV